MSPAEAGKRVPTVVADYFDARNRRDVDAILRTFSVSAVVRDEHEQYTGRLQIRRWLEAITAAHQLKFDIVNVTPYTGDVVVTVRASGQIPGSPFTLRYAFTLLGETIARLEINLVAAS